MRSTIIPTNSADYVVRLTCSVLRAMRFSILDDGSESHTISAQSDRQGGFRKEVHVYVSSGGTGKQRIEVEVRNLGLEISRDRKNDLLEIQILRDIHKVVYQKSRLIQLALSA